MGALDDLLTDPEEKRSALDMLISEPAPKTPTPSDQGFQGLIKLADNPISIEQAARQIQQNRQAQEKELLRAAGQVDSEVLANKVKSGQPLTEVESRAWQEQSGQAIPTRELENTAILAAGAFAPMAAVGVNTLGRVGGTALGEGLLGAGINVGLDTGEALGQGRLPDLTEMAKNAATGAVAGAAGGALGGLFSGKIKDVAKFRGTTPQQINKELQQAAKAMGVSRGEVLDDIIRQSAQTPEGAHHFSEYLTSVQQMAEPPTGPTSFSRLPPEQKTSAWIQQGAIRGNQQEAINKAYMNMGKSPKITSALDNLIGETEDAARQIPRAADDVFPAIDPNAPVARPMMPTGRNFAAASRPPESLIDATFQSPAARMDTPMNFTAPDEPGTLGRAYFNVPDNAPTGSQIGSYFGAKNTLFTQEMYTQAAENLRKKSKQLRVGIDPSDFSDLVKVGGYYLEGGMREFADWSARMVDDFGEGIRPHLRQIYDESVNAIRRVATNERVLPSGFDEAAVVSDLARDPAKRTLKNINISRLDDDELSNLIDNAVRESPEFQIPNETVAFDVLKERARRFSTGTIDKFLEDYNPTRGGTPEGDIRKIASEVIAAENVLKNHMEGETMNLAKLIAEGKGDREAFRSALLTDLRLLRKVGGVSSEFGRALGSRRIKATGEWGMEERFLREVNKVIGKDANLDQIATRISQIDVFDPTARQIFLRDLVHATTREKIDEVFYNSILSGIVTQGRNILGNLGVILVREGERPLAAAVDAGRAVMTGRQRERYFSESLKSAFGLIEGTREGIHAGLKSFRSEVPQFGLEAGIMSDLPTQRIGGAIRGTKGRIVRVPSRALMATDDFFKAVAYRMELNARAYREARNIGRQNNWKPEQILDLYNHLRYTPTDPIMKAARNEALLRTFQTPSGKAGRGLIGARDSIPLLRYFLPFVRTPLNIMEFGIERIPGVNILSILNRKSQGLAVDWTDELAKTAMGTMIAGGVFLAHKQGMINGFGPPERSGEEKAFLSSGRQRYALNIGGQSISFQNFEPISTILGVMADTADAVEAGVPVLSGEMAVGLGRSIGRNLTEKSFGMGFDTFLNLMTGDLEKAKTGAYRTAAGFLPFSSLTRGIATGLDPTLRRVQTLEDAFRGNLPGLRGDMEPVMDIWGRDVVTEAGVVQRMAAAAGIDLGLTGQILDGMSSPLRIRELTSDPATLEVNRLFETLPEDETFRNVSPPGREYKHIGRLDREQYVQYVKISGQRAHEAVTRFVQSPEYQRMPDEIKRKAIQNIIGRARKMTRNELFRPGQGTYRQ